MLKDSMHTKKILLIIMLCSVSLLGQTNLMVKKNSIATVQWLYRMENKLEKIENIDQEIESYQAILDLNKKAMEDERLIKDCTFLPPLILCSALSLSSFYFYCNSFFNKLNFESNMGIPTAICSVGFYLFWNFNRKNTINCIQADKRIINKLQKLREKFDEERAELHSTINN